MGPNDKGAQRGRGHAPRPTPAPTALPTTAQPSECPRTARDAEAAARLVPPSGSPSLDRLAELAARLVHAEAGQVSLLTDVQVVAASSGSVADPPGTRSGLTDSLCHAAAALGAPLVVPDTAAEPRFRDLQPVREGRVGAYLGVPLVQDDGTTVGALCVFGTERRGWTDADVAVLTGLAPWVSTELELQVQAREHEQGRSRWALAIEAGGIGTYDWDLVTGELLWDQRMIELFGYDERTFDRTIEAFASRIHPDDLHRVNRRLQEALASGDVLDMEFRIVAAGGALRWAHTHGRVLRDAAGKPVRMLGTSYDATDVRSGEARVARVLESMSAGFMSLDRDWTVSYVNAEGERMLRRSREELLGRSLWELFPETVGTASESDYRRAMDLQAPVGFEVYHPAPLDAWHEVRAWPSPDGLSLYFLDVSARRAAQREAERVALRTAVLADVASELTGTLDAHEAVGRLARLVVPALGDWSIVSLVDDDPPGSAWAGLRDIGWWHADPELRPLVERYSMLRLGSLTEGSMVARALASGRRITVPRGATEAIAEVMEPGDARDALFQLGPESMLVLPLRARGRTLGLLSVFRGPGWAGTDVADRDATAAEVADRAGLALDSALAYAQQRQLSEALQRSLLTAPPQASDVEIAVRYVPAAEAAQVGGDWYDAFLQPDATALVIGDVIGHDTAAAVAMGQLRGLLRGIAATTGEGPAAVLSRLDQAMEQLETHTTATVLLARLEQTEAERVSGVIRLRWSSAGHLPPLVLDPGGCVRLLGWSDEIEADLLLGVDPGTPRTESQAVLRPGATVLLYTDGLVERRDRSLDDGLDRLRAIVSDLAGLGLDDLCDEVLTRMLPAGAEDDVALAAVRLHREYTRSPRVGGSRWPGASTGASRRP